MFDPWLRNIPWKKKWQPTSVFLPGESHGQRSLVGYSPWGCKQLDMTEQLTTAFFLLSLQEVRSFPGRQNDPSTLESDCLN